MIIHWMRVGFVHGVMNTDNMSISGETIDYGPCAFMDTFSRDKVFSSIDRGGRYAYGNQLNIAKWNLVQLANCLVPLVDAAAEKSVKQLEECISGFIAIYEEEWLRHMARKFGIFEAMPEDVKIVQAFLAHLEEEQLDFTISFRELTEGGDAPETIREPLRKRLEEQSHTHDEAMELMRQNNPVYIPRNHQVERAIQAGVTGDFSVFERMNACLNAPFDRRDEFAEFELAPEPREVVTATFCGT